MSCSVGPRLWPVYRVDEAQAYLERMNSYFSDAVVRETVAGDDLKKIEGSL